MRGTAHVRAPAWVWMNDLPLQGSRISISCEQKSCLQRVVSLPSERMLAKTSFLLCRPYTAKCEPLFSLSPLQRGMPKRFWLILSSGMLLFLSALLVILPQQPLKH